MKASRELDALIAEKVMGRRFWLEKRGEYTLAVSDYDGKDPWTSMRRNTWEREKSRYRQTDAATAARTGFFGTGIDRYSSEIAAAWTVVESVAPRFRRFEVHAVDGAYVAMIEGGTSAVDEAYIAEAEADTAPLAICLAALKALGVEVPR